MPTTPTSDPVPSENPADLLYNAGALDSFVNSTAPTFTDRLSTSRPTLLGLTAEFPLAQANADAAAASATSAAASATAADASELAALAYRDASQFYSTQAAAARDSSFANARGAETIAAARALVADNDTFIVYAAGAVTFQAYRRLSSSTQVLLGEYPAATAGVITSGEIFANLVMRNDAANGATRIAVGGRNVGLTIPIGSTGANSLLGARIPCEALRGQTIRITQRYTATAGFVSAVTRGSVVAQSTAASGAVTNVTVTGDSFVQSGTEIVQTGTLTVPADSDTIHLCFLVQSASPSQSVAQSIQVAGVSYIKLTSTSTQTVADGMLETRMAPIYAGLVDANARIDDTVITSGDVFPVSTTHSYTANGATLVSSGGKVVGLTVPNGSTGRTSYIAADMPAADLRGQTITITQTYTATAGFSGAVTRGSVLAQSVSGSTGTNLTVTGDTFTQVGTEIVQTGTITVPSDSDTVGLIYQVSSAASAVSADYSIQITSSVYVLANATNDSMLDLRVSAALTEYGADYLAGMAYKTTALEAGAGKTYATPKAANDAITARTQDDRSEIRLWSGTYSSDPEGWKPARYATIKGYGPTKPVIHKAGADGDDHSTIEPIWIDKDCTLDGVKITAQNARYAVHAESGSISAGAIADCKVNVIDSWIEHLGNHSSSAWTATAGWGCGISSGWEVRSKNTVYKGPFCGFSYHTNAGFTKPTLVENIGDTLIGAATDASVYGLALRIEPAGSGQRGQHIAIGCTFVGDIFYQAYMLGVDPAYQPANHCEIELSGYGNTPAVFRVTDTGFALRVRTYTGAGSSVSVSGDAVPIIFGNVTTYPGVTNLTAYLAGDKDVREYGVGPAGNVYVTALGKRLGNCTSVNKTLTVTANGSTGTMIFNSDYTNASNATILAAINTALALTGICTVDTYQPGLLYRPRFTDEEKSLLNNGSAGIIKGSILAFDGTYKRVRLMTSSDDRSLFAGVAWQDIYPGEYGRVKTRGWLPLSDIRTSASSLAFGAAMSVGSTAGSVDAGGSQGLLRAVRTDAVEVAP